VKFSLIPRDEKFFELLSEHAQGVLEGIDEFKNIIENWSSEQQHRLNLLKDHEKKCDNTAHIILDKINRTFVTPIDREDIFTLAKQIDDIIDLSYKAAMRMQLFGITKSTPELIELTGILQSATQVVVKAVSSISDLSQPKKVLGYCIEINRFENLGDSASEQALQQLFTNEKDAIEVIKWKEIYDTIEEAIDTCEDVANTIESIVVKYG
jgi:predicted phosphate transport protein (TIGR00153 family)